MQRVINYGSFLQAYGLKQVIEDMGHNVEFADFRISSCIEQKTDEILNYYKIKSIIKSLVRKAHNLVFYHSYKTHKKKGYQAYLNLKSVIETALKKYLNIENTKNYSTTADVLIIGSDEVFNCLNSDRNIGYSLDLFGKDNDADKLISYAASFGSTTYEKLCLYGVQDDISELLKKFNAISIRDKNSRNIVQKLTNITPFYNIDPVLLYPFDRELANLAPVEIKNYIIVYAYTRRITADEGKLIKQFAKKNNKILVSISGYQTFCDRHIICEPFEVLNYFKNADYIITDTFHGAVISIKYNKKFAVFTRSSENACFGNEEKLLDLLEHFSLTSQIIKNDLKDIVISDIDYDIVNSILKTEIKNSEDYLSVLQ